MVVISAMGLQLRCYRVQQVGMGLSVDFTAQDLLGALHRKRGDLLPQFLFGTEHFLIDLRFCRDYDPLAFGLGLAFRLFDDLSCSFLGLRKNLLCMGAGLAKYFVSALGGELEILSSALSSRQTVSDLLLPLLHRAL